MRAFSQRLPNTSSLNQISQTISELQRQGVFLLDLTESNPTKAVAAEYPHSAIAQTLSEIGDFTYRPEAKGMLSARLTIVEYYARREISIEAENVLLSASTSEAYTHLFQLLCDPGEAVLAPSPSYPLFDHLAALASVQMKPYRLLYDGSWHIDFDHLRKQVDSRTKAIVTVNPNNPTGHFLRGDEWRALRNIAIEYQLPIISDEVFLDYPLEDANGIYESVARDAEVPSFVLNGLSKTIGMPQMKLAWTIVSGPLEFRTAATERLDVMADAYLSAGTPVQMALPGLMKIGEGIRRAIQQRARANWHLLQQALANTSASACHLEGGWSAVVRLPAVLEEEAWVLKLMCKYGVVVQPGFFFDMDGGPNIVMSLLTEPETFRRGYSMLKEVLKSF